MLIGNLGRDPELSYSQNGTARARFSLATSERYKDRRTGADREEVEWHNVVVFGKTAENCAKYLVKGRSVYVEGKSKTRSYEKDGQTRYIHEIVGLQVVFLGGAGGGRGSPGPEPGGDPFGPGSEPGGRCLPADDDIPF